MKNQVEITPITKVAQYYRFFYKDSEGIISTFQTQTSWGNCFGNKDVYTLEELTEVYDSILKQCIDNRISVIFCDSLSSEFEIGEIDFEESEVEFQLGNTEDHILNTPWNMEESWCHETKSWIRK